MSLSSELADPQSVVMQFFAEHFPDRQGFWRDWGLRVSGLPTLRPSGSLAQYPWALVGTALDYRLRVCWKPYSAAQTVAALGATARYPGVPMPARALWHSLVARWLAMMNAVRSSGEDGMTPAQQGELARMCMVMAAYESVFRSGRPSQFLLSASSLEDLLGSVPANVVADLISLVGLFKQSDPCYLHPRQIKLNPEFEGSVLVDGADGDVILDRYLWDFKTTIHSEQTSGRFWPYQLLGYGLLDASDEYQLKGAGIYLSRQGVWISWDWAELCGLLGANPDVNMAEWRLLWLEALCGI